MVVLSDADRSAIEAIVANQAQAWNRGDAEGYGERALPDIIFTNVIGGQYRGRDAVIALWRSIFKGIYKGNKLEQRVDVITLVTPDVAIAETVNKLTDYEHTPAGMPVINEALWSRMQQVMVRKVDGWWVASGHNVPVHSVAAGMLPRD